MKVFVAVGRMMTMMMMTPCYHFQSCGEVFILMLMVWTQLPISYSNISSVSPTDLVKGRGVPNTRFKVRHRTETLPDLLTAGPRRRLL